MNIESTILIEAESSANPIRLLAIAGVWRHHAMTDQQSTTLCECGCGHIEVVGSLEELRKKAIDKKKVD